MGTPPWKMKDIPIPPEARINHYDNQVSLYYRDEENRRRRRIIGRATSESTMRANNYFKVCYPELWALYFGTGQQRVSVLQAGLYASCLSVARRSGLYADLRRIFGALGGNVLMDCALALLEQKPFEDSLSHSLHFTWVMPDRDKVRELLARHLTAAATQTFRRHWLERCATAGVTRLWLCLGACRLPRRPDPICVITAVSAADGTPVTWFCGNGGAPDAAALTGIIDFLRPMDISVEGLIADAPYARAAWDAAAGLGLDCLSVLDGTAPGWREMYGQHGNAVRREVQTSIDRGVHGLAGTVRPFADSAEPARAAIFFDTRAAFAGAERMAHAMRRAMMHISSRIGASADQLQVPSELAPCFGLTITDGRLESARCHIEAWQQAVDTMGYVVIVSARERSVEDIHSLYRLRNATEPSFSTMPPLLDPGTGLLPAPEDALAGRLCACFTAAVLRAEIMPDCRKPEWNTETMANAVNSAVLVCMPDGRYHFIPSLNDDTADLLATFGVRPEHFMKFADRVNEINETGEEVDPSGERVMPVIDPTIRRRSPKKAGDGAPDAPLLPEASAGERRGSGRPGGRGNTKTIEPEAVIAAPAFPWEGDARSVAGQENACGRRSGARTQPAARLTGSEGETPAGTAADNGMDAASEPAVPVEDETPPRRKRGRPRIHPLPDPSEPRRGPGRPRIHPRPDPTLPRRGRGRPRKHPHPEETAAAEAAGAAMETPAPAPAAALESATVGEAVSAGTAPETASPASDPEAAPAAATAAETPGRAPDRPGKQSASFHVVSGADSNALTGGATAPAKFPAPQIQSGSAGTERPMQAAPVRTNVPGSAVWHEAVPVFTTVPVREDNGESGSLPRQAAQRPGGAAEVLPQPDLRTTAPVPGSGAQATRHSPPTVILRRRNQSGSADHGADADRQ